jgi:agmatinase
MNKEEKINNYDPNGLGLKNSGIFGLPFEEADAELVIIPVPWEVTVSYGGGTVEGPQAVLEASKQVDVYDSDVKDAWKAGIFLRPIEEEWLRKSDLLRKDAEEYITFLEDGGNPSEKKHIVNNINLHCEGLNQFVFEKTTELINQGKLVALLGGDHSTPFGFMKALGDKFPFFGVLQIDAHADLRQAYEGFQYSHASIFYNALEQIPSIKKLVQVGIRDYCEEEANYIIEHKARITTFFDKDLKEAQYSGITWAEQVDQIVNELPKLVYISCDIDGLDPKLCPNTGTPVAGGFELDQIYFLLKKLVKSGRKIIGFDLNEVSPGEDEWDANVGARLLYKMCNMMLVSNNKLQFS